MFTISNPVISNHLYRTIEMAVETEFNLCRRPLPKDYHLNPFPEAELEANRMNWKVDAAGRAVLRVCNECVRVVLSYGN